MTGFSTPSKGTAGVAPIVNWLGLVADRLTMLQQFYFDAGGGPQWVKMGATNYVNQFLIWNPLFTGGSNTPSCILDTLATAPDGTNTAQHIAEAAITNNHYMIAGMGRGRNGNPNILTAGMRLRFAIFAKKAERTRCVLRFDLCDATNGIRGNYQTVFDLAGGQIGVAGAAGGPGSPWVRGVDTITSFGNGWYLCSIEATAPPPESGDNYLFCSVYIDQGSGTGGINTNYAGNGTSGILTWRASCLPPVAWQLGYRTFFDDFTTLSTIDVNNTLTGIFNWWVNNHDNQGTVNPTPANKFSISSPSILKIQFYTPNPPYNMAGIATNAPSGPYPRAYVGTNFYALPALFESSCAYDTNVNNLGGGTTTFWSQLLENSLLAAPGQINYQEVDFFEQGGGGDGILAVQSQLSNPGTVTREQVYANGYPPWLSNWFYGGAGPVVWDAGSLWQCILGGVTGAPHSDATHWTAYTPPSYVPTQANSLVFDATQQHLYSCLWFPQTYTDLGGLVFFVDNIFTGCTFWGSKLSPPFDCFTQVNDGYHVVPIYGSGQTTSIYIDNCSVTQ